MNFVLVSAPFVQFSANMKLSEDGGWSFKWRNSCDFWKNFRIMNHTHTWVYSFSDIHPNFHQDKTNNSAQWLPKPAAFCIISFICQPVPPVKNTKQPWWNCSLFAHHGNEVPSETNPTPPCCDSCDQKVTRDVAAAGRRDPEMLLPAFPQDIVSCRKNKR